MRYLPLLLLVLCCTLTTSVGGQAAYNATVTVSATRDTAATTDLLYGQFIEHLGRCIDGGLYDADNPLSDERGFRNDVLELVKPLNVPLLRFPGGTVTKIYHWKNGIGPKSERRKRPNLIWGGNIEYDFGTAEFIEYCREIGAEPMLVVNMATGTPEEASEWVEYCNGTGDTYWANLRREHGYPEPFNVKYWGIGNEESADADAGKHYEVDNYIADTWQFIKLMKLQDRSIDITVVGDTRNQEWNQRVLEELHPAADHLAVHFYAVPNDTTYPAFLSSVYQYDAYLDTMRMHLAKLPETGGLSRWYRFDGRQRPLKLAIDEWGIWNMDSPKGKGTYNLEYPFNWGHALGTAAFLHMFHRNHDIIGLATWAQTVNILAPIMTSETEAWTQTVYTPLLEYRERMLPYNVPVEVSAPGIPGTTSALDVVASVNEKGDRMVLSIVNLDPERGADIDFELPDGWRGSQVTIIAGENVYSTSVNEAINIRAGRVPASINNAIPASIIFYHLSRQ